MRARFSPSLRAAHLMAFDREHRIDTELNRLLDDLTGPEREDAIEIPGKRTRVEQLAEQLTVEVRSERGGSSPGRRTLVERMLSMADRLRFDDFRVRALKDVLGELGGRRK